MNRRGFIGRMAAAAGILPALPAIAAHDGDQEDKYWEAQSHIDQLYDEIEPPIDLRPVLRRDARAENHHTRDPEARSSTGLEEGVNGRTSQQAMRRENA
jgi:hypothetical protein